MQDDLRSMYVLELEAFHDAVDQLQKGLPQMAAAAGAANLVHEFEDYLKHMRDLVCRFERVFSMINLLSPADETSLPIPFEASRTLPLAKTMMSEVTVQKGMLRSGSIHHE